MDSYPNCPLCNSEYTYSDGVLLICPECGHEWTQAEADAAAQTAEVRDANGNVLQDGDSVSIVKNLSVKGASSDIKIGTKIKNIRLIPDAADGHNIDCKIPGFGAMALKSEFVKKV